MAGRRIAPQTQGLARAAKKGQGCAMTLPAPDGPYVLDHVAFGVPDAAAVTPFLVGELGGRPFESGPGIEFLWWQWQFARGGAIEIIEPDGPPGGFVHRFLEARGSGVHHVTFKVPDLAAAAARVRSLGYEIVGYSDESPIWKECFLHPKQAQGIVIQLAEANPAIVPEGAFSLPYPESPAAAAEPADIVGLRVSVRSEASARRQWETVLGGACEKAAGGLRFCWPDSPLRISACVDPAAPEGPVAIEVAAPLSGPLPEGPHPVLGVPFVAASADAAPASQRRGH
jgi:methylmalonyl-CoA/ethylmalonyl-CoA epimerase